MGQYTVKRKKRRSKQTDPTSSGAIEWHKKLRHISKDKMMRLIDLTEGISLNKEDLKSVAGVATRQNKQGKSFSSESSKFGDHWS